MLKSTEKILTNFSIYGNERVNLLFLLHDLTVFSQVTG